MKRGITLNVVKKRIRNIYRAVIAVICKNSVTRCIAGITGNRIGNMAYQVPRGKMIYREPCRREPAVIAG